jgi:hypothetical protein
VKPRRGRLQILGAVLVCALAGQLGSGIAAGQADEGPVSASVQSTPASPSLPPGFIGVSLEYDGSHRYTGADPRNIDPVLLALLGQLAPQKALVMRIGGNSADATWWPIRRMRPPGGVKYALSDNWLATTRALASHLGAHLIMGINLAAGRPAIAVAEARAFLRGLGRKYLQAFEVGNEPDLYNKFPWYRDRLGRVRWARNARWDLRAYIQEFARWWAALPKLPLAGPAFAQLQQSWIGGLGNFLNADPEARIVTLHRYPLRAGVSDPTSSVYPSIANLLSDQASSGLAQSVAPYISIAHGKRLTFRVGEMNSASSFGQRGVSDTFASALWVLDTLFNLASVGTDGVNFHSLPGAAYELFSFRHSGRLWEAFVHPEYYGLLMFRQAFPPGAQLLQVNAPGGPVKIWATQARDGRTRVVLINKDTANSHQVRLQVPGAGGHASLEWLQAPSPSSTHGVTLGRRSFGDETTTGTLPGPPQADSAFPVAGSYVINLPAASAALLTQ